MSKSSIKTKITPSSGNVFADLGFDEAEAQVMAMRADVMIALEKTIRSRGMTQSAAASLLGVSQARVSDLMRHRTEKFSLDMLMIFSAKLGKPVKLQLAA